MDFEITPFDNILTLQYKSILTAKLQLKQLLESYKNRCIKLTQQKGKSSFYKKRNPEDGQINFKKTNAEIYNLIRGVTRPFPGAFCYNRRNKIFIWEAAPFDDIIDFSEYEVGEVIENLYDMPVIKTEDGTLLIKDYESKNKLKKGDILK
jgi:methionyl-tRNA formyltransferase